MSSTYSFEAYSFASRFSLRDVAKWMPDGGTKRVVRKTQLVVQWTADQVAYAFDFGALVLVNLEPEKRAEILRTFERNLPREPHPPLREDVLVETREGSPIEVTFDKVVIPMMTPETMEVVATVLAQSASLDYYDEDLEAILDRIWRIATEVSIQGRLRGKSRDLVRFIGAAIASQVEIISAISLLDKPDLTWENELADRLHDRLRYHLEINERYKAVEVKLQTTREALTAFLEMTQTKRMVLLEAAIVVLIVAEIVLGFLKLA